MNTLTQATTNQAPQKPNTHGAPTKAQSPSTPKLPNRLNAHGTQSPPPHAKILASLGQATIPLEPFRLPRTCTRNLLEARFRATSFLNWQSQSVTGNQSYPHARYASLPFTQTRTCHDSCLKPRITPSASVSGRSSSPNGNRPTAHTLPEHSLHSHSDKECATLSQDGPPPNASARGTSPSSTTPGLSRSTEFGQFPPLASLGPRRKRAGSWSARGNLSHQLLSIADYTEHFLCVRSGIPSHVPRTPASWEPVNVA